MQTVSLQSSLAKLGKVSGLYIRFFFLSSGLKTVV
nr:MAG TPA: hypothetical protein [Caudoviricetes sp.]